MKKYYLFFHCSMPSIEYQKIKLRKD
uniref:Uncharacterized protein n=1 Tax=Anguilla anguilla TaxID=7936 RepID=A0A0E9UP95_ANGAN